MRKFPTSILILSLMSMPIAALAKSKAGHHPASTGHGMSVSDMQKLSVEATKQMNHCEKLQGGLAVQTADFKNLSGETVDAETFVTTLNKELEVLGPSKKAADALAALPGGQTRLWAEVGSSTGSKGRKTTQIYTLSIYAKDGDRQICKVTSELTKSGHR